MMKFFQFQLRMLELFVPLQKVRALNKTLDSLSIG